MAGGTNKYRYMEAPVNCWCGAPLTLQQRRQWVYRKNRATREQAPPSCTRTCAMEYQHSLDPGRYRRAGFASFAKRKDKLFRVRVLETCTLPPGPERDRYIYVTAYKAGRAARNREARRRQQDRVFGLQGRDYRVDTLP